MSSGAGVRPEADCGGRGGGEAAGVRARPARRRAPWPRRCVTRWAPRMPGELDGAGLDALDLAVELVGRVGRRRTASCRERAQRLHRGARLAAHASAGQEVLGDHAAQLVEPRRSTRRGPSAAAVVAPLRDLLQREPHAEHAEPVEQLAPQLDREVAGAAGRRTGRPTAASGRASPASVAASVRRFATSSSRSVRPVSASRPASGTTVAHSARTCGSLA